jgi:hypothetical protein
MVPNAGKVGGHPLWDPLFADWTAGNQHSRMFVSGVILSASAVALLARCLQRAGHIRLADDVGLAVDANWSELKLAPNEEDEILAALNDCPALLQPLRDALQASGWRRAEGLS